MKPVEIDGEEEGTSNNVYFFSLYDAKTLARVAVERQNVLCKGVWLNWTTKYTDWKNLLVYSDRQPGPELLSNASPEAQELTRVAKFLEGVCVLPPAPRPIWATIAELEGQPPHQLVDNIRSELGKLRGKLYDLYQAYPLWREMLEAPEGGITCVIATLSGTQHDMVRHHAKWGHNPDWLKPIKKDECTGK